MENQAIKSIESLDELQAFLNANPESESIDYTSLPVFGGTDIENTDGVFSWDESRVLVQGTTGFDIEPRCSECGEADFHCDHDDA